LTQTRVLQVPRSMPMSLLNQPRIVSITMTPFNSDDRRFAAGRWSWVAGRSVPVSDPGYRIAWIVKFHMALP
jgi:hypothetical protein